MHRLSIRALRRRRQHRRDLDRARRKWPKLRAESNGAFPLHLVAKRYREPLTGATWDQRTQRVLYEANPQLYLYCMHGLSRLVARRARAYRKNP